MDGFRGIKGLLGREDGVIEEIGQGRIRFPPEENKSVKVSRNDSEPVRDSHTVSSATTLAEATYTRRKKVSETWIEVPDSHCGADEAAISSLLFFDYLLHWVYYDSRVI